MARSTSPTSSATTNSSPGPPSTTSTRPAKAGTGAHRTIPEVIEAVLSSSDPATACGADHVTAHYLNVAYGGKQGCVQAQSQGSAARSVDLQAGAHPSPEASRASVKVVPRGGIYDGEKLTVMLVRRAGSWKIDALESNAPVGP